MELERHQRAMTIPWEQAVEMLVYPEHHTMDSQYLRCTPSQNPASNTAFLW